MAVAFLSGPVSAQLGEQDSVPDRRVLILGAVDLPGGTGSGQTLDEVIFSAGGLTEQAYALGAVLLRPTYPGASNPECRERHRSWLGAQLSTVPGLDPLLVGSLLEQVGSGRLMRVPVTLTSPVQEDVAARTRLGTGDVLIVPQRPSTVAVVGESLAGTQQWKYEAGFRVEDYLRQYLRPSTDQRALALYLPNGQLNELRLNFWNYERQVVPPGSVIWMGPSRRTVLACG